MPRTFSTYSAASPANPFPDIRALAWDAKGCEIGQYVTYLARWRECVMGTVEAGAPHATGDLLNSKSGEHTSELQSHLNLLCPLLLVKKKKCIKIRTTYAVC